MCCWPRCSPCWSRASRTSAFLDFISFSNVVRFNSEVMPISARQEASIFSENTSSISPGTDAWSFEGSWSFDALTRLVKLSSKVENSVLIRSEFGVIPDIVSLNTFMDSL